MLPAHKVGTYLPTYLAVYLPIWVLFCDRLSFEQEHSFSVNNSIEYIFDFVPVSAPFVSHLTLFAIKRFVDKYESLISLRFLWWIMHSQDSRP